MRRSTAARASRAARAAVVASLSCAARTAAASRAQPVSASHAASSSSPLTAGAPSGTSGSRAARSACQAAVTSRATSASRPLGGAQRAPGRAQFGVGLTHRGVERVEAPQPGRGLVVARRAGECSVELCDAPMYGVHGAARLLLGAGRGGLVAAPVARGAVAQQRFVGGGPVAFGGRGGGLRGRQRLGPCGCLGLRPADERGPPGQDAVAVVHGRGTQRDERVAGGPQRRYRRGDLGPQPVHDSRGVVAGLPGLPDRGRGLVGGLRRPVECGERRVDLGGIRDRGARVRESTGERRPQPLHRDGRALGIAGRPGVLSGNGRLAAAGFVVGLRSRGFRPFGGVEVGAGQRRGEGGDGLLTDRAGVSGDERGAECGGHPRPDRVPSARPACAPAGGGSR